jgi:hypothetical protein
MEKETELLKVTKILESSGYRIGKAWSEGRLFQNESGYHEQYAIHLDVIPDSQYEKTPGQG